MNDVEKYQTDVLVIGGGGAGVRAALEAAAHGAEVIIVSKGPLARSGVTPLAEGSLVAAMGHKNSLDNPEVHAGDLIREGRSLADYPLIKALTEDAAECVADLERYGTQFRQKGKHHARYSSPGETYPRNLNIKGKGFALMMALKRELKKTGGCSVIEDVIITRLLMAGKAVIGALGFVASRGSFLVIEAKSTIIATGGNLQLWPHSDTPPECTGDGLSLAYGCGAELIDMEMVLYYPLVALKPESARGTIISYEHFLDPEICGGRLLNDHGEEFLPSGRPPVRDIMVQLIFNEINSGRGSADNAVFLDLAHSPEVLNKARYICENYLTETDSHLKKVGLHLLDKPVAVAPATHYTLGGVRIDTDGKTTVEGLFAAGEAAGNVHGANRMAGNALTETQVFGKRAGKAAALAAKSLAPMPGIRAVDDALAAEAERYKSISYTPGSLKQTPFELKCKLKDIMGRYVGFPRSEEGLKVAIQQIRELQDELEAGVCMPQADIFNLALIDLSELTHMLVNADLVARSALKRTESRGHHQRSDYPETDDHNWLKHTRVKRADGGEPVVDSFDVVTADYYGAGE